MNLELGNEVNIDGYAGCEIDDQLNLILHRTNTPCYYLNLGKLNSFLDTIRLFHRLLNDPLL